MSVHRRSLFYSSFRTESPNRYEKGSKLSGIMYVHRISDKRFTGTAGRNFDMLCQLCGDEASKNVVLVTNMWGEVSSEVGQDRESKLSDKFFKPVLDKGAKMARHYNTIQSTHDIIRMMMVNNPVVLQIQRELVDQHKDIGNTAAGIAINQELNEQMRRHRDELKGVEEEIKQALKEKDEETREELEEERKRLQEQMDKAKKDSEMMASEYAAEKERMEEKVKEIEREAKKEMERAEAEYRRQSANLDNRPQDAAYTSAVNRPMSMQEIGRPQYQSGHSDDNGSIWTRRYG